MLAAGRRTGQRRRGATRPVVAGRKGRPTARRTGVWRRRRRLRGRGGERAAGTGDYGVFVLRSNRPTAHKSVLSSKEQKGPSCLAHRAMLTFFPLLILFFRNNVSLYNDLDLKSGVWREVSFMRWSRKPGRLLVLPPKALLCGNLE
jgi:hypothetical protein